MMWRFPSVWTNTRNWVKQGFHLLNHAQAESLGGQRMMALSPSQDPEGETSPFYPGNWSEPFGQHWVPKVDWFSGDWQMRAVGQTFIGGRRRENHAFFRIEPIHHMLVLASGGVVAGPPDWRVPQVAIEASSRCFSDFYTCRLGCCETHLPNASQKQNKPKYSACQGKFRLSQTVELAHQALLRGQKIGRLEKSLASAAWLHVCCGQLWFAQVGSTAVFRWRDGQLKELAFDPYAQHCREQIGQLSPPKMTRFLGSLSTSPCSVLMETLEVGDIFVACSRGVHRSLPRYAMEQVIHEHENDLETACQRLLDISWNSHLHYADDMTLLMLQVADNKYEQRKIVAQSWESSLEKALFES